MNIVGKMRLVFVLASLLLVPEFNIWAADVTSSVNVIRTRPLYDFVNLQTYTDVSIENISAETIAAPLQLVIDSITTAGVTVANADGTLADGRPYFDYSANLGDGVLSPGEVSGAREIRFDNPNTLRFDFTVVVLGEQQIPTNNPPIANAGPDQTVHVTNTVFLDGSASSDLDGDSLSYFWQFTARPAGSAAVLSDATAVNPSFVIDLPGTYTLQLIVNDGTDNSAPDIVNINTENSPPVANAGPDQTAYVGDTVTLDGSGSSDVDGNSLSFAWSIITAPSGSSAALSDPSAVNPSFVIDLPGTYSVQLIVNDGLADSAADTVIIITDNSAPVANAGPNQTALVGETVTLDGSASNDVDGDTLTYSWSLTTMPTGSSAVLSDPTAVNPSFTIDLPGTYVAQLVVNDGLLNSAADTVSVVTENSPPVANAGPNQTALVSETVFLDGSASSDVDGNSLTYHWSLITLPTGSAASLSDPTSVNPTFIIDLPGTYIAQLIVNDGQVNSAPDSVTITTENTPPVANAGTDQTAFVGDIVTLDGSASTDVDGDSLSYSWSFTSRPAGSTASLSDPTAVNPNFSVDVFGTYVLSLVVNDGTANSAPDSVSITTENSPPVANAGPNQTAYVTDVVTLDGSSSSDVDGNTLTYSWFIISMPTGSTASLSDSAAVNPSFTIDLPGTYIAQLIVNDGIVDSTPDTVIIVTENTAPTANAGTDQTALVGDTVTLDGSGSSDVDGDQLTYSWTFSSMPAGSAVVLTSPSSVNPSFTIDLPGTYVLQLIVNDGLVDSAPDSVVVSTENSTPIANAGPDQTALVGDTITLDGSASSDADGNSLTFSWSLTTVPSGSTAVISDPAAVNPTFDIDLPGTYVAQLIVNDGTVNSAPDTITVTTENSPPVANAGPDQTVFVGDIVTLDGSNSSDADGDQLTFTWSFTSIPPGSTAVLSDDTAVMPTFEVDVFGTYVAQLIVNDGSVNSVADTVTIQTENSAPVAVAGPDQTVLVGDTVNLDGSGSYDVDGDTLTYTWSFSAKPPDSIEPLSDTHAENPIFVVDAAGTYVLQLIVNDGTVNSAPDTVIITTENSPPVADAGTDQNVLVGDTVTLDGGGSHDVDGDSLTYAWSFISRPFGSTASLSDDSIVNPTFDVDKAGTYVVQLMVNDGTVNSAPDSVVIITVNRAPVANAGADQDVIVLHSVSLNGTASSDPDGDLLSYQWTLISAPAGSTATLTNDTSAVPTLFPDLIGTYEIQLVVSDAEFDSTPDSVIVTAGNTAPIANAGADQTVSVDDTVTLNGSGSSDPDGHSLTYSWTMTSFPAGSSATLSDAGAVSPTFVADVAGDYVLQLVVNDGFVDSAPSSVTITASQAGIVLALLDTDLVGVTRTAQVQVSLGNPAPAGGVTVTVSSDDTGILTVEPPATAVIAEGDTTGQVTVNGIAPGTTTLRGNAAGYSEGTLDVGVTLNLISVPTTLNVPLGQTVSYPISIAPNPAPTGGVIIQLVSSDPGTAQLQSSTVTIPAGAYSANATILGNAVGSVTVNASNTNYAADTGDVNVTAELNITDTSVTMSSGFTRDITIRLQSAGGDVSAPTPITVTLTSDDPSCVAVTSPQTIDTGFVSTTATLSYGGTATVPCSATVTATAPNIVQDTVSVTVNPSPGMAMWYLPTTIGSGLQNGWYYVNLGYANHGGVTLHIQSSDPDIALVSPNNTTAGTEYIDIPIADGNTQVAYYIQAIEGNTGTTTITASAPGFIDGTGTVTTVQPGLRLNNLAAGNTTLSLADSFVVTVGIPNATHTNLTTVQQVRAGGSALTATVTNSQASVAQLLTSSVTAQTVTVQIQPSQISSATSVAAGGVALEPLGAGTTTVSATIPGVIATDAATQDVTITAPSMDLWYLPTTIGSGLQNGWYYVNLGASDHGGVTLHLQSSDPSIALVSPNASTPGTEFIDIDIPDGGTQVSYYIQGMEGATGTATITASAPGFVSNSGTVTVVQPGLRLGSLNTGTTTLSPNDPFVVTVGVPNALNTNLNYVQAVRAGGSPLTATVVNSDDTVGQLVTSGGTGQAVTVQIVPGQNSSSGVVATGGVAFDPQSGGTTTISATIPGLIATTAASADVTVTAPGIALWYLPTTIGSGLQNGWYYVNLGASNHGGVTVHIQSDNPSLALVSPNASTPGTDSIDIFIADGNTQASYYIQGLEGVTGVTAITASAPGFVDASANVTVVQPALRIGGLLTGTTTLSPDDAFIVTVGVPTGDNANLATLQQVRAGTSGLTATVTNSVAVVGQLVRPSTTGQTATVQIMPGENSSPYSVAADGVAFDPLTSGTTTVSATIPGFIATAAASVNVSVSAPTIDMWFLPTTVGAGLQNGWYYVNLGASNHGGVSVHIESSNPSVVLLSPNATTAGTASIDLSVADGSTQVAYYIQALEGSTGTVTVTASAPGFIDGSGSVTVVQPALRIVGLNPNLTTASANDPFNIQIGTPNASNSELTDLQSIRYGGSAVTVTIVNVNASVAQLVTSATTDQTVTAQILPGSYSTPNALADGGVAFDPVGAGDTTVIASIPSYITTSAGSVDVSVTEAAGVTNTLNTVQADNDGSSGGGAFDPYWLMVGMLYVAMVYRRKRRTNNQH